MAALKILHRNRLREIGAVLAPVALASLLATETACAQIAIENIVSYTVYADGSCTGTDAIPAFIGTQTTWFSAAGGHIMGPDKVSGYPFPKGDLWILGFGFNVEYTNMVAEMYPYTMAMAGVENGLGGDYLVPKFAGPATKQVMFPLGFAMRLVNGDISSHHVDMHVSCPTGGDWNATLTLYTAPAT